MQMPRPNYPKLFARLRNVIDDCGIELREFTRQVSQAPIWDDQAAAQVLEYWEGEMLDVLDCEEVSAWSEPVHQLMENCLAELRGETVENKRAHEAATSHARGKRETTLEK